MKLTYQRAWKIEGGYAVGHPHDATPDLQNIEIPECVDSVPLLRTDDYGETWKQVGYFRRNAFGDFNLPTMYEETE